MKKNTIVTFKNKKIKIPFDILVDPKTAHELETIKNPFSKQKAAIPKFAVAVYDVIKGAEVLYNQGALSNAALMNKGRYWFQKYFIDAYGVLLD
jgi:hypothetical protein|tara:strand:+ start:236 stop:517 length:282 start_codon:yes stop_codon:yes gene_type:complete